MFPVLSSENFRFVVIKRNEKVPVLFEGTIQELFTDGKNLIINYIFFLLSSISVSLNSYAVNSCLTNLPLQNTSVTFQHLFNLS